MLRGTNMSLFACHSALSPLAVPSGPLPLARCRRSPVGFISAGVGHPGPCQTHCSVPCLPPQSGDNDIGTSGFVWGRPSPREVVRPVSGYGQHWAQTSWTIGSPRPQCVVLQPDHFEARGSRVAPASVWHLELGGFAHVVAPWDWPWRSLRVSLRQCWGRGGVGTGCTGLGGQTPGSGHT